MYFRYWLWYVFTIKTKFQQKSTHFTLCSPNINNQNKISAKIDSLYELFSKSKQIQLHSQQTLNYLISLIVSRQVHSHKTSNGKTSFFDAKSSRVEDDQLHTCAAFKRFSAFCTLSSYLGIAVKNKAAKTRLSRPCWLTQPPFSGSRQESDSFIHDRAQKSILKGLVPLFTFKIWLVFRSSFSSKTRLSWAQKRQA